MPFASIGFNHIVYLCATDFQSLKLWLSVRHCMVNNGINSQEIPLLYSVMAEYYVIKLKLQVTEGLLHQTWIKQPNFSVWLLRVSHPTFSRQSVCLTASWLEVMQTSKWVYRLFEKKNTRPGSILAKFHILASTPNYFIWSKLRLTSLAFLFPLVKAADREDERQTNKLGSKIIGVNVYNGETEKYVNRALKVVKSAVTEFKLHSVYF